MQLLAFKRGERAPAAEPIVTIQKGGIFSLNEAAVRLLVPTGDPIEVRIGFRYSEDGKIAGLERITREVESNTYPLRKTGTSRSYLVSGRAFARHLGFDLTRSRRFHADLHDPQTLAFHLDIDRMSG
jgi:hypothetical protein